jgi:hypothetical protein
MEFTLTIEGVQRHPKAGSLSISKQANGRTTASFSIVSQDRSYRPAIDDEVLITVDGGASLLGGLIDAPRERGFGGGQHPGIVTTVNVVDFHTYAERRYINDTFPGGTLDAFLEWVADNWLSDYGVTVDSGQVTGPTLPELEFRYTRADDALNQAMTITAEAGEPFVWEIDSFKVLRAYQPSTEPAPFDLVGDDLPEVIGDIEVGQTRGEYANRVIVQIPTRTEQGRSEVIVGDGTQGPFPLDYTVTRLLYGSVTLSTGGAETLGIPPDSPIQWSYDPDTNSLTRDAGNTVNGTGYTVTFDGFKEVTAVAEDAGEIAAHGLWEKVITIDTTPSETTAQAIADAELAKRIYATRTVRYQTTELGLAPGQSQTITVPSRDVDVTAILSEIVIRDWGPNHLLSTVTAVVDTAQTNLGRGWRETYKLWASGTKGSGVSAPTTVTVTTVTGGGVGGAGTSGTLARWTGASLLGDSAGVVNADVHASAAIAWSKISKTGSSLADLATRSAGDLSSGNLAYALLPSGSGTWSGTPTISGTVSFTAHANPVTNYTSDLGTSSLKYRSLYSAELIVESLVAQEVISTIGGRVLVAPTTALMTSVVVADTAINVKHNSLANGDRIRIESGGQVEWMAITSSGTDVSPFGWQYSVTRNLDGSGANDWPAGTAVVNTGTTGDGFIDLYATSGVLSGTGPTIVGNVRTGTTYSNISPRWAIGNLNGLYGVGSSDLYGCAFGDPSAANITIEPTNGIRIRYGTTNKITLDASGNASFSEDTVTIDQNGIRIAAPPTAISTAYGYGFETAFASSGPVGLFTFEDTSGTPHRTVYLTNHHSSASVNNFVRVNASRGVNAAYLEAFANASSSALNLSAGTINLSGTLSSISVSGSVTADTVAALERSTTPSNPSDGAQFNFYMKADKAVIQYNHGGTIRYYYLDLTSGSGTWTHTTTAP